MFANLISDTSQTMVCTNYSVFLLLCSVNLDLSVNNGANSNTAGMNMKLIKWASCTLNHNSAPL